MDQPTKRETYQSDNRLRFDHQFGKDESYGDAEIEFTGDIETFQIETYTTRGKDRDGYGTSDESEMALNEAEARELYLLLHIWLEQRSG